MDTFLIQVPDGWLPMIREEYEERVIRKNTDLPQWLTSEQMEQATSIPARRWVEMAKRGVIPYVPLGERTYRFDLVRVYEHLERPATRTSTLTVQRSMRAFMDSVDEPL